jgi:hypothetical protein
MMALLDAHPATFLRSQRGRRDAGARLVMAEHGIEYLWEIPF